MSLLSAMRFAVSSITNINRSTQILSENIASANDEHYVRRYTRSIDIATGGVGISEVLRATDSILQRNLWNVKAEAAAADKLSEYYTRLQELSGATTETTLLSESVTRLTDAFKEMEAAPTVDASQQSVLFAARAVRDEFERLSAETFELRARINNDIVDSIDEINDALNTIVNYNGRIGYESRLSTITTKVENFVDEQINFLSESFDIRVFRGPDKSFRVYTRNGLALVDSIASQFRWDAENERIINTVTGFDVTDDLPQGRLRTQIDFIASKERPGTSQANVVENDDFRLGVLSKYEKQLDILAQMLIRDRSGTNQGHADGRLVNAAGAFANGVPINPEDTFAAQFGSITYPDQIYVRENPGFAPAGGAFFVDRQDLAKLHEDLEDIIAKSDIAATHVDIQNLTPEQLAFFTAVPAAAATPPASNQKFTLSLNATAPLPAVTNANEVWANRADVDAAIARFGDLLTGIAVPDNILKVGSLNDFVLKDGTTISAPTNPAAAAPFENQNYVSLAQVRGVIEDIDTFLADTTVNPIGTATGSYNNWDAAQQHFFREALNQINPDIADTANFAGALADPHVQLPLNHLRAIRDKIAEMDSEVLPPTGSTVTSSLEHYWSDKMFVPQSPMEQDLEDISRYNFDVNPNLPSILDNMRYDSDKIGKIVQELISSTRSVSGAGLSISDRDYAGVASSFAVDTARRASESDNIMDRTNNIKETLETNYYNTVGVNLDAEMSKMVVLQNSYAATARVLTTTTRMFEILEQVFV